jgi:hypothetical protein
LPTGSALPSAVTSSGDVAAAAHAGSDPMPSITIDPSARGTYTVPAGGGAFDRSTSSTRAITARSSVCAPDAAIRSPVPCAPVAISPTYSVAVAECQSGRSVRSWTSSISSPGFHVAGPCAISMSVAGRFMKSGVLGAPRTSANTVQPAPTGATTRQ